MRREFPLHRAGRRGWTSVNRRVSVLIVDDEPRILRFVRAELESDGYRVLVAASGRQAIELHESEHPALVIPDRAVERGVGGLRDGGERERNRHRNRQDE